jgi:V/A-type H+-transporting ATPase subunit K
MIEALPDLANVVLQSGGETGSSSPALTKEGAAAVAVGLAALATGYAQRGIGSAAVGAVAEDGDNLGPALIFTVLPETLIIIAFVTIFVV